jgi:hypothetical protein
MEEEDNFSEEAFELDVPVSLAEEQLRQNPSDLETLIKMLFYYRSKKDLTNGDRIREQILRFYSMDESRLAVLANWWGQCFGWIGLMRNRWRPLETLRKWSNFTKEPSGT